MSSPISRPSIAGRSQGSSSARPSPSTPTPTWPTGMPCSPTARAREIAPARVAWRVPRGLPLPLGGNVVRRDLGEELMRAIARDLKASIAYGLAHRGEALAYAAAYSRGLDAARTDRFVGMYVNDYSMDLGPQGRRAVAELFTRAARAGVIPAVSDLTFISASP